MTQALIPGDFTEYTLERERKKEKSKQTIWKIKNLSLEEEEYINQKVILASKIEDTSERLQANSEAVKETLAIGLLGAINFKRKKGSSVWERNEKAESILNDVKPWTDNTLAQINKRDRDELAAEIIDRRVLEEEEEKNL